MLQKYAIVIFPSGEDKGFIAVVPELAGCCAFGRTEEEAFSEAAVVIDLRLETAREEGREIPEPGGREILADILAGEGIAREQMA